LEDGMQTAYRMTACRKMMFGKMALPAVLLSLAAISACTHPGDLPSGTDTTRPDDRKIPFQQEKATSAAGAPTPQTAPHAPSVEQKPLPFKSTQPPSLPAGTLLTVRLENSLSGTKSIAPASFTAVVDEPVIVEGNTLLARGTTVTGRVEAASDSEVKRDRAYLRLTLNSITVDGNDLPLQTSSLFARATLHQQDPFVPDQEAGIVDVKRGRHLTFRLLMPLSLPGEHQLPTD
jgi:hypothetical protein